MDASVCIPNNNALKNIILHFILLRSGKRKSIYFDSIQRHTNKVPSYALLPKLRLMLQFISRKVCC